MLNSGDPFPVNVLQMYDYKMLFFWAEMVFHQVYLLENFGSFTGRFLGSCFYLIHPSYKKKSILYKTVNLYFPFDKYYNIYVIFKCENYFYDNKFLLLM